MDRDKGWLEEVLKDVNEDVKSWPKWLRDEDSGNHSHKVCSDEQNLKGDTDTDKGNFE